MFIEIDDSMECICVDGLDRVGKVEPFVKLFPEATVYGGGICIHYEKVPKDEILKRLEPFNLPEVKAK